MIRLQMSVCYLTNLGGGNNNSAIAEREHSAQIFIVPHARTLRNAREQVRLMVIDGFSVPRIRRYLNAWLTWWVKTSQSWRYQTVLSQFIHTCKDSRIAEIAMELLLTKYCGTGHPVRLTAGLDFLATV
ncbi:hypothetical protein Lsan_2092 [Legionella santicrucis]|uniref:Uncharacterized protein n=1 Tax=Legionella santicrucis TaxID=45074 RepID=A0A0W0YTX9_9GAMM|nr:hypothetical protein Lsan_2092 [Legionella santicrucis]